jgi:hypothetical protein
MTAGILIFPGAQPSRSRQGTVISAELRWYLNETTTPATVYTDAALTVPHPFPIVSDDAGRFPLIYADEADVFSCAWNTAAPDSQTQSYDFISTTTAADTVLLDEMNAVLSDAMDLYEDLDAVETAVLQAQAYAAEAAEAATGAPGTNTTSSTSLTIGIGSKSLTVESNKLFVAGQTVAIASTVSPNNQMSGIVQSYSPTTGAMVVNITSLSGSGTFSAWTVSLSVLAGQLPLRYSQRTSDTVLGENDNGAFIDIMSGTFAQTFVAASSLSNGWHCVVRNSGTGDVTLTPGGGGVIDSLSTYVMYPDEVRLILGDGGELRTVVLKAFNKTFTASGSFVKPPGYSQFGYRGWGGGSSGGKDTAANPTVGGPGGGCREGVMPSSSLSASEAVTVGAGGAARSTTGSPNPGSATSLGTLISISGGGTANGGGYGTAISSPPYLQGALGENTPTPSIYGGGAPSLDGSANSTAGLYGAGAGGSLSAGGAERAGGDSAYGGDGGVAVAATSGADGAAPGGGGGATRNGALSGAGARGELRLWGAA